MLYFRGMNNRNEAIDALRGFAILTMILSGSIAFGGVLPAWMYHAQVPPPAHVFNPQIPGITWVDLVFPFFLFSMGAAIPLALHHKIQNGLSVISMLKIAFKRFILLAFFALFTQHMKAWVIAENPTNKEHLLSMFAFLLLFFQLYNNPNKKYNLLFNALKVASFSVSIFLLMYLPFWNGQGFNFYKSDIILMVLANMALFGIIIYYFTYNNQILRVGILPFIMAVFLAAKDPSNGFAKSIFNFSEIVHLKFDWLYKFYFLKYLFIIIPGTIAGDIALKNSNTINTSKTTFDLLQTILLLFVIVFNVYALYTRQLTLNLLLTLLSALVLLKFFVIENKQLVHFKYIQIGFYLLILGLFFEAYEGGIKKDSSTYSYYFVTSGLAFLTLVVFSNLSCNSISKTVVTYLASNGKNPMVAYVSGSLILLPLLAVTHAKQFYDALNFNCYVGFLKGLLFTSLVSAITVFFVKRNWFWKT
jgi:predicted acyltransferase